MADTERRRFRTVNDWHEFVKEIQGKEVNLYSFRAACYQDIEGLRGRPLLVYAVQFPSPKGAPVTIDLADIDGFVDLISAVPDSADAVDVLLHSPGGAPEATERIVDLLRSRFDNVSFLVPHSAYSAATMLALSGDDIVLHPAASLGPIDPQINGIPARSILRGFNRVRDLLKKEGPEAIPAYLPLIEKHSLEMLELCEDAEGLSKELVGEWLGDFMFAGIDPGADKDAMIEDIVDFFAKYDEHKTHGRPLTFRKLDGRGLNLSLADGELRDLLREAHILLSGFFGGTHFVKLYETSQGLSWGRQFQTGPAPERSPGEDDD